MFSHFYLGELPRRDEHGDRVIALYDPSRAVRWIELVGNDVRTAVGVFSSQRSGCRATRTAPRR